MNQKIEYDDMIYVDAEPKNKPYLAPLEKLEDIIQPLATTDQKALDAQPQPTEAAKPESRFGNTADWLVGAAPMLVGLLGGNTRIGAQVAGQGLQDMAKTRAAEGAAEARLAARSQAQGGDSARYYRTIRSYDESGMPVTKVIDVRRPDQALGELEIFRPEQLRTDPTKGELGLYEPRTRSMTPLKGGSTAAGDYNLKQEKDLRLFNDEWINKDPVVKESRPALAAAYSTMSLLSGNNPIATDVIKTQVVRASGQASNSVSDRDVKGIGTVQSVRAKVDQIKEEATQGRLTEENRYYLQKLLENMARNREDVLLRNAKTKARKHSVISGIPVKTYMDMAMEDIKSLKVDVDKGQVKDFRELQREKKQTAAQAKRQGVKSPTSDVVRFEIEGAVYSIPKDKIHTLPPGAKRLD